jgi:hypothetical protein
MCTLVPTLCVGMPSCTLRVPSGAALGNTDAERRGRHSHAERGNELRVKSPRTRTRSVWSARACSRSRAVRTESWALAERRQAAALQSSFSPALAGTARRGAGPGAARRPRRARGRRRAGWLNKYRTAYESSFDCQTSVPSSFRFRKYARMASRRKMERASPWSTS